MEELRASFVTPFLQQAVSQQHGLMKATLIDYSSELTFLDRISISESGGRYGAGEISPKPFRCNEINNLEPRPRQGRLPAQRFAVKGGTGLTEADKDGAEWF